MGCHSHCGCYCACPKKYTFGSFLFDLIMIAVTGGAWILWICVREITKNRC